MPVPQKPPPKKQKSRLALRAGGAVPARILQNF